MKIQLKKMHFVTKIKVALSSGGGSEDLDRVLNSSRIEFFRLP